MWAWGGAEELWSGTNWGDVEWYYGAMGAVRWSLASTGELCDGAGELWDGPVGLWDGLMSCLLDLECGGP